MSTHPWHADKVQRQVLLVGGGVFEALEHHRCAMKLSTAPIAKVDRFPDLWMLQLPTSAAAQVQYAIAFVRFCPWCGISLTPPPRTRVCVCTHADTQHEVFDILADVRSHCHECPDGACTSFRDRGLEVK